MQHDGHDIRQPVGETTLVESLDLYSRNTSVC